MELYEGGQYRIDIVGSDSSIIIDSQQGVLRGNVIGSGDTVLLDTETRTLVGNVTGDVTGNLTGNVSGNLQGEFIDGYDNRLIDTSGVYIPLHADLYYNDTVKAYDRSTNTFTGRFVGTLRNENDEVVFDSTGNGAVTFESTGNLKSTGGLTIVDTDDRTVLADLLDNDGNTRYARDTGLFQGHFKGNIIAADGSSLLEHSEKMFFGRLSGDITNPAGQVILNQETQTLTIGKVVSSIVSNDGEVILSNTERKFYGTVNGDIGNQFGSLAYDYDENLFTGRFKGDLVGNITNADGSVIYNFNSGEWSQPIIGTLRGNVQDTGGNTVLNIINSTLTIDSVTATDLTGNLSGSLRGNIYNSDGQIVFDGTLGHISNSSFSGYIYDSNSLEVFDPLQNIISTKTLYSDNLVATSIDLDAVVVDQDGIIVNVQSAYSNPAFTGRFFRETQPNNIPDWFQQGIRLEAIGGSWLDPNPITAGTKLPAVAWVGAIKINENFEDSTGDPDDEEKMVAVAGMYGYIPDDAVFDLNAGEHRGCPGELWFVTQSPTYGSNYMKFDSNGQLSTELKEFKVHGETGVTPSDTSTPDSWLQATVNGETKFIPLYS
mgnify:FL=1